MKITIEKTVTEEIEIAIPCFRKKGGDFFYITESSVLQVRDCQITMWKNSGHWNVSYKSHAEQAFSGVEITEHEFNEKYNEVINSFKENNNPLTVAV